jgi:ferredoxin
MPKFSVEFPGTSFPAQQLEAGDTLSEKLTAENSPILFGCRTGICGTCLVRLDHPQGCGPTPADAAEREVLEMIASDEPQARLACQIRVKGPMSLCALDENL